MAWFKFDGFQNDSTTARSAMQSGETVSAGVSEGTATIVIRPTTQGTIVAPAPVLLEAVDPTGFVFGDTDIEGYVPAHHEITYVWSVRGDPLPPYAAPVNLLPGWNDANLAYGPKVAFALPAGEHVIDLWCVKMEGPDAGTTATASWTVSVASADDAYPGTRTICFSNDPSETWAGEFPGSWRARTIADINAAIQDGGPYRVLFKRGQVVTEFETAGGLTFDARARVRHVGAWGGSADRARIDFIRQRAITLRNDFKEGQFTIADIHFRSDWDPVSETGVEASPYRLSSDEMTIFHVHNCRFNGEMPGNLNNDVENVLVISDTVVTDWRNYGLLAPSETQHLAILGCDFHANLDAMHGGPKVGRMYNNHGPVRIARALSVYVAVSSFFNRQNWISQSIDQPCLRLNTSGLGRCIFNIERVSCESGTGLVNDSINANQSQNGTYLFDKVLLIGTAKGSGPLIATDHGGATMRNIYGVQTGVPQFGTGKQRAPLNISERSGTQPEEAPQRFHNLTFVNLRTDANYADGDGQQAWQMIVEEPHSYPDVTLENNVILQADASGNNGTLTDDALLDLSTPAPGIVPRYKGIRFNYRPIHQVDVPLHVPGGASFTIPYGAVGEDLWDDPDGVAQPTNQAYWQLHAATDTRHQIYIGGNMYYAHLGDIAVAFDADGIRITNLTENDWFGPEPTTSGTFAQTISNNGSLLLPYQNGSQPDDFVRGTRVHGRIFVDGVEQKVSVDFEADGVFVTNKSDADWLAGEAYTLEFYRRYSLRLDRTSRLPPMRTEYANPATIPLPRPLAGSPAFDGGDAGMRAYDDLMMTVRPNSDLAFDRKGNPVLDTGNERGALLEA